MLIIVTIMTQNPLIVVLQMQVHSKKNKIKQIMVVSKAALCFNFHFKEEQDHFHYLNKKWSRIRCNRKMQEYNLLMGNNKTLIKLLNPLIDPKNKMELVRVTSL